MDNGQRVVAGRYRLLAPLGSGGMGTVWRAEDLVLGRAVAVKEVTFPHGLSDEDRDVLRERTRREARAAARLDHPSAVTVYDVVEEGDAPYLVMELVEAQTLSQVVRSEGPLSPQRTARVGLALLGALEAAHRQGIVHRDVKPGNVLLGADDRVVLTDFGIASSAGDSSITHTGLLLGSPSYIAPERARGEPPGPASDLWSLGATLFTAVEGKPPYDAGEPLLTVTAVVTGEHAPFQRADGLANVLEGLLERDPGKRLTVPAARRELEQVAATTADPTPTLAVPVPVPVPSGDMPAKPGPERTAALEVSEVREAADEAPEQPVGASVPAGAGAAAGAAATGAPVSAPARPAAAPAERGWNRPPPIATRSRRRPRAPLVLLSLALVLALGVVGLVVATDPSGSGLPGGKAEPGSSDGSGANGDEEPADGDAGQVPDGWQAISGEGGWKAAVPPSYAQSTFDGKPQYKDQDTGRTLRITTTGPGGGRPDAVKDRREQAGFFAKSHDDYREINISAVDYRGLEAADWEFTYTSGGASLHAISRVFVADGRGYSLFFQTRSTDDWASARADFEQIAASFQTG